MDSKPVDLKLTKKESQQVSGPTKVGDGPKYPWGLQLRLDQSSLEKLGVKNLPEVGVLCQVIGVGRVISVSQTEEMDGDKKRNVEIQIEKLNLAVEDEDEAFEQGAKKGRGRAGY